jgi:CRP/FNR family transcriptional regulator, cyclic AMP receptor protein
MIALKRRTDQSVAQLRDMDLFSACSKAELRHIGSLTMMVTMDKGAILVEEDKPGLEFFVIAKGRATASRNGLWLAEFGAGSFFGELALLDRGQRTATVVADTDMSLLVFSPTEFHTLRWSVPSVGYKMTAEVSRRLRHADELLDLESRCGSAHRPIVSFDGSHKLAV